MMNEPIDILDVATRRYDNALSWWNSTKQMNQSENAAVSMAYAGAMLDVARADLSAARDFVRDMAHG